MWKKLMLNQDATIWFLLGATVLAAAWNTAVIQWQNPGASISDTLLMVAQKWPVLPLMIGVLIGHVFWPQYRNNGPPSP